MNATKHLLAACAHLGAPVAAVCSFSWLTSAVGILSAIGVFSLMFGAFWAFAWSEGALSKAPDDERDRALRERFRRHSA